MNKGEIQKKCINVDEIPGYKANNVFSVTSPISGAHFAHARIDDPCTAALLIHMLKQFNSQTSPSVTGCRPASGKHQESSQLAGLVSGP